MVTMKSFLFGLTLIVDIIIHASALDPPEFRLDANKCESLVGFDDSLQHGTCQTFKACEPYMSTVERKDPDKGPSCSKS